MVCSVVFFRNAFYLTWNGNWLPHEIKTWPFYFCTSVYREVFILLYLPRRCLVKKKKEIPSKYNLIHFYVYLVWKNITTRHAFFLCRRPFNINDSCWITNNIFKWKFKMFSINLSPRVIYNCSFSNTFFCTKNLLYIYGQNKHTTY